MRARWIAVTLLLGAAVAGCGGSSDDDDGGDPPATTGAASGDGSAALPPEQVVDPCTVLTDAELLGLGQILERKRTVSELDAHGCGWNGRQFDIGLTTNPDSVAVYWSRRNEPNFRFMNQIEVAGRPGVEFSVTTDQACAVVLNAGTGSISAGVIDSALSPEARDECADARHVMALVAAKLPPVEGS